MGEDLRECYEANQPLILDRQRLGFVEFMLNVPLHPLMQIQSLDHSLNRFYDQQSHTFKVNLSFGFILRNIQTQ